MWLSCWRASSHSAACSTGAGATSSGAPAVLGAGARGHLSVARGIPPLSAFNARHAHRRSRPGRYDDPGNFQNPRVLTVSAENLRWALLDGVVLGVYVPPCPSRPPCAACFDRSVPPQGGAVDAAAYFEAIPRPTKKSPQLESDESHKALITVIDFYFYATRRSGCCLFAPSGSISSDSM